MATTFGEIRTERQSFDPWGERRNPSTLALFRQTDTDPFRTSSEDHDRGYTGHEQLDDSGLIHMNGRIYDPELGRMLSPDPYVQIPEYSQNFNRYSYVLNNPLNKTDPSGYSWLSEAFDKIGDWFSENWRTVVAIVVAVVAFYAAPYIFWGIHAMAGASVVGTHAAVVYGGIGAIAGGISGAANAAIAGGNSSDILKGALVGGVQGGITGGVLHGWEPAAGGFDFETARHVVGHGVVGGAANEAMGGKFSDGFLSAAASAAASNFGLLGDRNATGPGAVASRTIRAGIVGGTASALGGGKFANGAWTAAFQHLLNAEGGGAWEEAITYFREAERGAAVFLDVLNPFGDPYRSVYYDGTESWYKYSKGAGDVGAMALAGATMGAGAPAPLSQLTKAPSGFTEVSRWGKKGLEPDFFVMRGPISFSNFLRSFKWEPKWLNPSNIPVPFKDWAKTGQQYIVPKNTLSWPKGWEKFKGIFGQRIYDP